jgi:AraC family transcriptional activator of pobA
MTDIIKTYDFKSGLPNEIEVIPISSIFHAHQAGIIQPHRADFYHILWFTRGNPVHTIDFEPIPIQPDTLLFINKNRVHFFDKSGDYDGWMLLFTDAFFAQSQQDTEFLRTTILFHDLLVVPTIDLNKTRTNLILIIEQLQAELAGQQDAVHASLLRNMLQNLLMLADRERRLQGFSEIKKGLDLDHTLTFKELLEKQFAYQKAVNSYAAQMGITERRLQQATAAAVGKTPKQMVEERIVLEAKRLLAHSNQSVKEIGFSLGFDEPTNFVRFVRRVNGQTPMAFKQHYAKE